MRFYLVINISQLALLTSSDSNIPDIKHVNHHFPIFGSSPRHEMLHNAIHHILKGNKINQPTGQ